MSTYSVQASSLISQDPQIQTQNSALLHTATSREAPRVSALPRDTVTLGRSARAQQAALGEALATNATPNKPDAAAPSNFRSGGVSVSTRKG